MTRAGTSTRAIVVALLAALLAGAAAGGAAASTPLSTASANARLLSCQRSARIDERVTVVGAWMRPRATARRLSLRIDLYQRPLVAGGHWTLRDDVPGIGVWTSPNDPLVGTRAGDVFKYRQEVGALVPAAYRFQVGFRWSNDAGAIVREALVTTATCRQPDLRPELVLGGLRAEPSPQGPDLVRYTVVVYNKGRSSAKAVAVAATFPGETTPGGHVRPAAGKLDPGASAVVHFTGPGCAADATPALFSVDPANAVDEASETNNELAARCPAP